MVTEAAALAEQFELAMPLAEAHELMGELHADLGEFRLAEADFERALHILDERGFDRRREECLAKYVRLQERWHMTRYVSVQARVEARALGWLARLLPASSRSRFVAEARGDLGDCDGGWQRLDWLLKLALGTPRLALVVRHEKQRRQT